MAHRLDKNLRAGLYARVSTEDKGQDPETQLRPLREYAERRGFLVAGEFVDKASGTTEQRPQCGSGRAGSATPTPTRSAAGRCRCSCCWRS